MDMDKIAILQQLLNCPDNTSYHDMIERIARSQKYLVVIMQELPQYDLKEKSIVINLLSKANELVRRCMDHEVKALGLTPEKFKQIADAAKNSDSQEAKRIMATLGQMQQQFSELQSSISKADSMLSSKAALPQTLKKKMQRNVSRKDWQKP
jgi:benzoyl-CoA reductase/2-hydroxyglutaryl-CoA dehydratase subunit BcrC/BadD/HgdB